MGRIKLLDCTLRDGGYVNDWNFGHAAIVDMIDHLEKSCVDILEVGFFKDEPYNYNRTVFNDVNQFVALVKEKKPNLEYAAMIEVVNPLPLEKLAPCDGTGADIIRVIVWKRMLEEGYEYCKGIVEKGYKLCVQPARVDQYSEEEFVGLVKKFSKLDPLAIYVVDSWGSLNSDQLLKYMHLADENMPAKCALGYHGHNTLMQASGVAQDMMLAGFHRDLMIDASIFGIGRGAGNLNTEVIAKYMNEQLGKEYQLAPMLHIYSEYIEKIFTVHKWGYSVPFLLAAQYGCNPNFASYYSEELKLNTLDIEGILQGFEAEDKIIYSKKKADLKLREYFKKKMDLAVIVPTCNRPESIEFLLCGSAWQLRRFGIDLIIYDSSSDDKTAAIVKNLQLEGCDNVRYTRYEGSFDGFSLDHKLIAAYQDFANQYQYLWLCRDGLIINIDSIYKKLSQYTQRGYEVIVVDAAFRSGNEEVETVYNDCTVFFREQAIRLVTLGTLILSSPMALALCNKYPVENANYSLWQMAAPFHYYAGNDVSAVCYLGNVFSYNPMGTTNSFWNSSGKAMRQWAYHWHKVVTNFPSIYDAEKSNILKIEMIDFKPFSPSSLLRFRSNDGLKIRTVKQYQKELLSVCSTPLWKFYIIALLPTKIARWLLGHPHSKRVRTVQLLVSLCDKFYLKRV